MLSSANSLKVLCLIYSWKSFMHTLYITNTYSINILSKLNLSTKYLGVTIQSDLKCNKHIDNISSTASKHLNFIKRNLKVISMFMTELVLWNLLQVYLAALHWTISSLLMLDLV
jgi:hypothetical protein